MPTKLVYTYLTLGYVGDEEEQSRSVISFSFFPAVVIQTIKDCMAQRRQTAQDTPDSLTLLSLTVSIRNFLSW